MKQLKHLLSHRKLNEGEIFALLINLGLEKYDPRKKKTRVEKTNTNSITTTSKTKNKSNQKNLSIYSCKNQKTSLAEGRGKMYLHLFSNKKKVSLKALFTNRSYPTLRSRRKSQSQKPTTSLCQPQPT